MKVIICLFYLVVEMKFSYLSATYLNNFFWLNLKLKYLLLLLFQKTFRGAAIPLFQWKERPSTSTAIKER